MNTDFKYFHWAVPKPDQELYGLYDLFDNHLYLLSYDFDVIWHLKNLIKSKIVLDIVDFSNHINQTADNIDNSIVENWGLQDPPTVLFQDVRSLSAVYKESTNYRERFLIKNIDLIETKCVMNHFKQDLQQQLFFFHYCLQQAHDVYKFKDTSWFFQHLLRSAELGQSYQHVLDLFLDISYYDQHDADSDVLHFFRDENFLYE